MAYHKTQRINFTERVISAIEKRLEEGLSQADIGRALGRTSACISQALSAGPGTRDESEILRLIRKAKRLS